MLQGFKITDGESQLDAGNICKFCDDPSEIILAHGNYTCMSCGTVSERMIDQSPEWKFFGGEDYGKGGKDTTRCGMPTNDLLPNSSLGSVMGFSGGNSREMAILRKYHSWSSMPYKERTLYGIFDSITTVAVLNGISKCIIDDAKVFYKSISEARISRGENRTGLIATSIYMSCKSNKVPRSAKEIAVIFNLRLSAMTRGCKHFQEIMKMTLASTTPDDFLNRYCSKLDWDQCQRLMCKSVMTKITEHGLLQRSAPPSVAAACLYICNSIYGWGMSKKDISHACDISEVTISKCHKELNASRHLLI